MSIPKWIPDSSKFIQTVNRFTGTFNNPTPGVYDFTNNAANDDQIVLPLVNNQIYFLEKINFGATVPEGDFLLSIATLPQMILKYQRTGEVVFQKPFNPVNYIDNQELITWIHSNKGQEVLIMSFTGVLNQIAAFVGITNIVAQVTLNIYEIKDTDFKEKWRSMQYGKYHLGGC